MKSHVPFLLLAVAACTGEISGGELGPGAAPPPGGANDPAVASKCGTTYAPGHASMHRLTNAEYANTVRDLLFTTSRPSDKFPPDGAGLSGYSNDSDHLSVSPDLVLAYYDAAESLAAEVLASKGKAGGAYGKLVTCDTSASTCAKDTVTALASRAFRRPATDAEVTTLLGVRANDADFDTGLADVLITLLISPKFLFTPILGAQARTANAVFALDDHATATRLSYFLWQTMPDDELRQLADAGKLADAATLRAQTLRMLKDPRASSLLGVMRNELAGLATLASPTGTLAGLPENVRASMIGEVDAFFADLLASDGSLLAIVTGDHSYVDKTLADYYGVPFTGASPATFVKVPAKGRTGLVTSAAILTATAGDVAFTHPVKRGKWATQRLLCSEPPAPPPGIPTVNFDPSAGGTPREKLATHTASPACSGCHQVMDTVGLGLENFDPFGKWRTTYAGSGALIDASGTLPSGATFKQATDMYAEIGQDDATRACLARQVFSYALARAATSQDDRCVASAMGAAAVTPTGKLSQLMTMLVTSNQFLMQAGEAP
jgi:Protein of unknown function (DUF1592)/Protein of unknown function (DUF1588)/Protein of unknown function (DUF1587)/Protein of unknown function (DUF1595)/Protein of unknown function (DUF1585)